MRHCLPIQRSAKKKARAKSASARVVLSGIRSHLGHAAFFLLRLLLAFVFRHDFNGGLFSRLCILLFSLGFRQDAVTERLDRSILRHYGKKRPRQHTRCVNNYSLASRRVVVSRDIARRLKPRELKTIIFFITYRDVLLHFIRVHLENNENRFRQSSRNRVEDAPHLLTPIHELEHSELFSFAETVLREIDVDRHLEVFKESLFVLF